MIAAGIRKSMPIADSVTSFPAATMNEMTRPRHRKRMRRIIAGR